MPSRTISVIFARIFTVEQCQHSNYFELGDTSPSCVLQSSKYTRQRISDL